MRTLGKLPPDMKKVCWTGTSQSGILMFVDVVVVDAVKDHDNILNISGCSHSIRVIFNAHTYNFNGYTLRLTTFSDGESK